MLETTITKKQRRDPREELFYSHFFGLPTLAIGEAPTRGDAIASALKAGYDESKAAAIGKRLLDSLDKAPFKRVLSSAGLTKSALALVITDAIKTCTARDMISYLRVALKLMGELEEGAQGAPININPGAGAQILIVQGATAEKMKALRSGKPALKEINEESTERTG